MITDEQLTGFITTELLNDPRLSLSPIEVEVKHGIVTLGGTVQSYRRKLAAHEIAASYEGVRDVVNHLQVKPPEDLSDREVARNVRMILEASTEVTKQTITVAVKSGIVTLGGHVGSHWECAMAEDVTRSARGVRDVENLITINLSEKVADEELAYSIEAGIRRTRGLGATPIAVAVDNGHIVLSGTIPYLWQKEMAEAVARRFGHIHLRNEIRVVGGDDSHNVIMGKK